MSPGFLPDLAVVIAHHDEDVRRGLIDGVSRPGSGLAVVGLAAETAAAHALTRRSAPDVAIVELELPWGARPAEAGGGLDVAAALRVELPTCAVVLVGGDPGAPGVERVGAAGWIEPSIPTDELVRVVRGAARRESMAHASWVRASLEAAQGALDVLGELDRAILEGMAAGDDGEELAGALHLTGHEVGRRAFDALTRVRAGARA